MNQLVARAVLRRLIGGRSCNRCLSTSTAALVVARPFDETAVLWRQGHGWGAIGGAEWRRAMSTAAERTKTAPAAEEKDRKESAAVDEKKKDGGEVMVSSYWGISRPKVTRDDGTEWPWNCFMVILFRSDSLVNVPLAVFSSSSACYLFCDTLF